MYFPKPTDWYKVAWRDVTSRAGRQLSLRYSSLRQALKAVYPEYKWEQGFFTPVPIVTRKKWVEPEERRRFLDNLARELAHSDVRF